MMHSHKVVAFALALSAVVAFAPCSARAWSNGGYSADIEDPDYGTHDWIADMALSMQSEDVSFLETTYHATYLIGTEAPDNPVFIGDSMNHHIYYYASTALQDNASAVRASDMYSQALDDLVSGNFAVAAYHIGAMTHYIADMGVFGHTMGTYTDWGAEVHHSDYEEEFESMLGSLTLPAGIPLGDRSAYDAATGLAYDITFGAGDIRPNTWMDDNYDWSDDEFRTSAMASLHSAVSAVASAINHLLLEAEYEPPGEEEPTVPDPPESLEAYLDDHNITLVWTAPPSDGGAPIIEYQVFRGVGDDDHVLVTTVSSLTLSWTDRDVDKGRTYDYWVSAKNSVGLGGLSEKATVTVPSEGLSSLALAAIVSAIIAALASGGVLARRRSRKG